MDEAARAREAAISIECKKDRLAQNQDGTWKLTLTIADLPMEITQAAMGTRYQAVFVELDDIEQPVDRYVPDDPGQVAKRHFEAICGDDTKFARWIRDTTGGSFAFNDIRGAAKFVMGIKSANELLSHPEKWDRLYQEYLNR